MICNGDNLQGLGLPRSQRQRLTWRRFLPEFCTWHNWALLNIWIPLGTHMKYIEIFWIILKYIEIYDTFSMNSYNYCYLFVLFMIEFSVLSCSFIVNCWVILWKRWWWSCSCCWPCLFVVVAAFVVAVVILFAFMSISVFHASNCFFVRLLECFFVSLSLCLLFPLCLSVWPFICLPCHVTHCHCCDCCGYWRCHCRSLS